MNAPLTYLPAYIGLFTSLMLAVACNAFLDIQYGSFGFEMFFWMLVFGWTLLVGWKQHGQANESGPQQQKAVLLLGLVAAWFGLALGTQIAKRFDLPSVDAISDEGVDL